MCHLKKSIYQNNRVTEGGANVPGKMKETIIGCVNSEKAGILGSVAKGRCFLNN